MRNICRTLVRCAIVVALSLAGAAHAAGVVEVSFVTPERFTDAGDYGRSRDDNLARLSAHLAQLGQLYLAQGQSLAVDVLDVDLAGRVNPFGRRGDIRVVNGRVDWPRISLRYRLEAGGRELQSGTEMVVDMNYLQGAATRRDTDPLRYEKAMLDGWFKAHFAAAAP